MHAPRFRSAPTNLESEESQMIDIFKLILQIGVVLLTARIVGMLFKKIHQPQVIGEMVAGILLGPTLFGWLAPVMSKTLFPPPSLGYLNRSEEHTSELQSPCNLVC